LINIINMKKSDWIDAATACDMLGVKPQTLYAYVSRGLLRAEADAQDARHSLYKQSDVEDLARLRRRPRARAEIAEHAIRWGEPVLTTSLTEVRDGMLWLRGKSIADCAEHLTLEGVAAHLWGAEPTDFVSGYAPDPSAGSDAALGPLGRALQALAHEVPQAADLDDSAANTIAHNGGKLVSIVTNALLGVQAAGPIHYRLGQAWGVDAEGLDNLRCALVLLSDHELNPSTFAVRVAASTGASLPAALLSGLATLSGPRHGGVASLARLALEAALRGKSQDFLAQHANQPPYSYGFGHPLYPDGDPRARIILNRLADKGAVVSAMTSLSDQLGLPPNIDAALAGLSVAQNLPDTAAFTIFATGRLVGWIAHAMEQQESGEIIRPRARYREKP
jgi:citrate synthase